MFASIVKNLSIALCCFYTISALSGQKYLSKIHYALCALTSIFLCAETLLLKSLYPEFSYLIPFLSLFLSTLLIYRFSFHDCLLFSLLSFGINLILFEVIAFTITLLLFYFPYLNNSLFLDLLTLVISLSYPLFLYSIAHSRRFQNGLSILHSKSLMNIGCIACISVLLIKTLGQNTSPTLSIPSLLRIILIFLSAFAFIFWWRSQITKSYRDKLRLLEMENLRAAQAEKDRYISQLEAENERMGHILHKDNRLLRAMADSVTDYLQTAVSMTPDEQKEKGRALADEIASIQADRQGLLSQSTGSTGAFPATGSVGIDALLAYVSKESAQYHIDLKFHFQEAFFQRSQLCMEENDMVHLLSDLIANAIIATRHGSGHDIEVSLLIIKGTPTISVADSGIPFEIETYMNFGLERSSTHLDDGGSGIGLMDIWKSKNKYRASLYIQEFSNTSPYSKRITFLFDRKNRYLIASPRSREILGEQSRTDLLVVDAIKDAVS